ncbi:MAG: hypothetical protein Aurels2KO_07700 [Aureliella sp.]
MLLAALGQYFFGIVIFVLSIFLVLLVLVQRGRGGGLTGALGGPGGQSAFGTKAGDLFTRITVVVAAVWIFSCAAAVYFLKGEGLTGLTGGTITNTSTETGSIGSEPSIGGEPATENPASDAEASADDFSAEDPSSDEDAGDGDAATGDEEPAPEGDEASSDGQ